MGNFFNFLRPFQKSSTLRTDFLNFIKFLGLIPQPLRFLENHGPTDLRAVARSENLGGGLVVLGGDNMPPSGRDRVN